MKQHNVIRWVLGFTAGVVALTGVVATPQPATPSQASTARPAAIASGPTATPTVPVNNGECQDGHCGRPE